ncbi:MAG: ATP synthase F1 subunit gamma [Lachnospiraceae bacterium]|nr:ATP synthase F1 subunit gamma [Lachnospiraceae bacterium]
MANAREIQSRIRSIQDTMKITNAMYMISSTKLRRARRELEETEPYFYTLQAMIARIIRHMPEMEHRYFEAPGKPEKKKCGYLVVTADKGMAGAYNHNVLKLAEEQLADEAEEGQSSEQAPSLKKNYTLLVVGEVGRQYFHGRKIPVDEHFLYTAQNPTMHRARIIAARVLELYESGAADEFYMIYTSMVNAVQTRTNRVKLLPLEKQEFGGDKMKVPVNVHQEAFTFKPSAEAVLDNLVPNYLAGYVYGALVESYCSEHNARMTAMQSANDSARKMLHSLGVEYNRVRQNAITQEITEVIAGAKAQKKKKGQTHKDKEKTELCRRQDGKR